MASAYGTLINSVNLYVDTSDSIHKGDDINLQLQGQALHCSDGQNFKVTLTEFSMHRPNYTVDENNSRFELSTVVGGTASKTMLQLTRKNYGSVGAIAAEFAAICSAQLATDTGVTVSTTTSLPPTTYTPDGDGDGLLDCTFTFASAHNITECVIKMYDNITNPSDPADSYIILGGDRVVDAGDTSLDITITNTTVRIQGRYPMQRTSFPHLYVRTDLRNTSIESSSLSGALGSTSTHTISSNILAKIPMTYEYIQYVSPGIDEFFVFLPQRTISSMRLFITDHKGRPLGRKAGSGSKTAAGSGTKQSTVGPLHFSATIRIDTIQRFPPGHLKTPPIPKSIPASKVGPNYLLGEIIRND
jgi:hypothetical protein